MSFYLFYHENSCVFFPIWFTCELLVKPIIFEFCWLQVKEVQLKLALKKLFT